MSAQVWGRNWGGCLINSFLADRLFKKEAVEVGEIRFLQRCGAVRCGGQRSGVWFD